MCSDFNRISSGGDNCSWKQSVPIQDSIKQSSNGLMNNLNVTDESGSILEETLLTVNSIMGQKAVTSGKLDPMVENEEAHVTVDQIRLHLRNAFEVSEESFKALLDKVYKRQATNVFNLTVKIVSASDLRPKTARGTTNPYVTINVPGTSQIFRTKTINETLKPVWDEEFTLKNLNNDPYPNIYTREIGTLDENVIKLDVWHHFDTKSKNQVRGVKDLRNFSNLIKETTGIANKNENHHLGTVAIPIKNIGRNGVDDLFPISKVEREDKARGTLHLKASITANNPEISSKDAFKSHKTLLCQLIRYHIKKISDDKGDLGNANVPWLGTLSPEANVILAQHSIVLRLSPELQSLTWWIAGSQVPSADAGWLFTQIMVVQKHLSDNLYDQSALECLANSMIVWIEKNLKKLRTFIQSFPSDSGVIGEHNFSSTIKIFAALESHRESTDLLKQNDVKELTNRVKDALTSCMKIRFKELIKQHLSGDTQTDEQVKKIITITAEIYTVLEEIKTFYSPILFHYPELGNLNSWEEWYGQYFGILMSRSILCHDPPLSNIRQMKMKFFVEMFLLASKELKPYVKVPISNMDNYLENLSDSQIEDAEDGKPSYVLADGSHLWQLYVNLGKINSLADDVPADVAKCSGIHEYHEWFTKGLRRWIELSRVRSLRIIEKAVEMDNLEYPVDHFTTSLSARSVSGIFTDAQIWWLRLCWPDPEVSKALLPIIFEDLCSYAIKYVDQLTQKVEKLFVQKDEADLLEILEKICTGLSNIEMVRDELTKLPDEFFIESEKSPKLGGKDYRSWFDVNMKPLIDNSLEMMDAKMADFIEATVHEMTQKWMQYVTQACEEGSAEHLLQEVLDPAFQLLHEKMNDTNFKWLLETLWNSFINLFKIITVKNKDKRSASYFVGIHQVLELTVDFFSPNDRVGLKRSAIKCQGYMDLVEFLESQSLAAEDLVARYYTERFEEQKNATDPKGELVVRLHFGDDETLKVEIIMAKFRCVAHEILNSNGEPIQSGQINSYVKMQCVPSEWFPNVQEFRTKRIRNSESAVFEETFECNLKKDEEKVSQGFVLFTLKEFNIGRPNRFIGESVIPLQSVDKSESPTSSNVLLNYLKVTSPQNTCNYSSLEALRARPKDRVASAFLRKIQGRVQCAEKQSSPEARPPGLSYGFLSKFRHN